MAKVIMLGLDAACLHIIMPWIEAGRLPYLGWLLGRGVYSELRTIIPAWTPPAWTSLFTGQNPGKHGIFDFFKYPGYGYDRQIVSSRDNRVRYLWEYLSEAGKRVIIINAPVTHPARKINGIIIPGFLAPESPSCYPPNILREYQSQGRKYRIYSYYDQKGVCAEKKLADFIEVTRLEKEAALYLAQEYNWDFLMLQFQMTDTVFHHLNDDSLILRFYQYMDETIAEIVDKLGQGADLLIVSDHGIGKTSWSFRLNSWLKKGGFLQDKSTGSREVILADMRGKQESSTFWSRALNCAGRLGVTTEQIDKVISSLRLNFIRHLVPHDIKEKLPRRSIDWGETRAYCPSGTSMGIRINLKGRELQGIVTPGEEYDKLVSQIIDNLLEARDPDGRLIFEAAFPSNNYYSGSEITRAPDILLIPTRMNYSISTDILSQVCVPFQSYEHKLNGLFAAIGPDIEHSGYLGERLSLLDIAPTILHLFGLPVPLDMDGRVLDEIFKTGSEVDSRPPDYQEVDEKGRIKDKIDKLRHYRKI